jgi:hypothetical protein
MVPVNLGVMTTAGVVDNRRGAGEAPTAATDVADLQDHRKDFGVTTNGGAKRQHHFPN